MKILKKALLTALSLFILSGRSSFAQPDIHTHYQYYEIHGNSAKALRRQMNQKGYKDPHGGTYDAETIWNVSWNYDYAGRSNRCSIAWVKARVEVTYRFPKWVPGPDAPVELERQWSKYMQCLQKHEEGHKLHGVKAAQEVERAIFTLGPAANCDQMGANANALGDRIVEKYGQQDVDYDLKTQHGRTQGATFPKNYLLRKKGSMH